MKPIEFWKLCESVSIFQATMLILGLDPGNARSHSVERSADPVEGYGAVRTALLAGVKSNQIKAEIEEEYDYDERGELHGIKPGTIDIDRTFIDVDSLIRFLKDRNFPTQVFGPTDDERYRDLHPSNEFYANKLAAAVDAWVAVTSERKFETQGTPKRWIEKWLREHASHYGLHKPDGTLNEDAIQQISKIVNWKQEGGAGKTPTGPNPSTPEGAEKSRKSRSSN